MLHLISTVCSMRWSLGPVLFSWQSRCPKPPFSRDSLDKNKYMKKSIYIYISPMRYETQRRCDSHGTHESSGSSPSRRVVVSMADHVLSHGSIVAMAFLKLSRRSRMVLSAPFTVSNRKEFSVISDLPCLRDPP